MNAVSIIASAIMLWGGAIGSRSALRALVAQLSPSSLAARVSAYALIPLYAAQVALVAIESRQQDPRSLHAWMKTLPIPVFDLRYAMGVHATSFGTVSAAIGLLETVAMAVIVLSVRHRPDVLRKPLVLAITCVFVVLSLAAPVMSTADPYEYAATGLLGLQAYAPPLGAFTGTVYAPYEHLVPLRGVIYGPLWVFIDVVQTALGSSVYQKIEAMRITNIGFIMLALAVLARAGVSRATLVGFALNPCTWFFFVANPHADIQGLVSLAVAYYYARNSQSRLCLFLIVAAGLIKLPFVLVGGAVLVPITGVRCRLAIWCTAIIIVALISYIIPGPAYINGLSSFAARSAGMGPPLGWFALAALTAASSVLLVVARRDIFGAPWLFQQMAIYAAPWYVFWGLPFALATSGIEAFLALLPLSTTLIDNAFLNGFWQSVFFVVVFSLLIDTYATLRHRSRVVPA